METSKLFNKKWIPFKYSDIFEVKKGKRVVIEEELEVTKTLPAQVLVTPVLLIIN